MAGLDDPQIQIWLEQIGIDPSQDPERAVNISDILILFAYSTDWLIEEISTSDWFDNGANPEFYTAVCQYLVAVRLASETPIPDASGSGGPQRTADHSQTNSGHVEIRVSSVTPDWNDVESMIRVQGVALGKPLTEWFISFLLATEPVLGKEKFKDWCSGYLEPHSAYDLSSRDETIYTADNQAYEFFMNSAPSMRWSTTGYAAKLYIWVIDDLYTHGVTPEFTRGRWSRLMADPSRAGLYRDDRGRVRYQRADKTVTMASLDNTASRVRKAWDLAKK